VRSPEARRWEAKFVAVEDRLELTRRDRLILTHP